MAKHKAKAGGKQPGRQGPSPSAKAGTEEHSRQPRPQGVCPTSTVHRKTRGPSTRAGTASALVETGLMLGEQPGRLADNGSALGLEEKQSCQERAAADKHAVTAGQAGDLSQQTSADGGYSGLMKLRARRLNDLMVVNTHSTSSTNTLVTAPSVQASSVKPAAAVPARRTPATQSTASVRDAALSRRAGAAARFKAACAIRPPPNKYKKGKAKTSGATKGKGTNKPKQTKRTAARADAPGVADTGAEHVSLLCEKEKNAVTADACGETDKEAELVPKPCKKHAREPDEEEVEEEQPAKKCKHVESLDQRENQARRAKQDSAAANTPAPTTVVMRGGVTHQDDSLCPPPQQPHAVVSQPPIVYPSLASEDVEMSEAYPDTSSSRISGHGGPAGGLQPTPAHDMPTVNVPTTESDMLNMANPPSPPNNNTPAHVVMQPDAQYMMNGLDDLLNLADPQSPDYCVPSAAATAAAMQPGHVSAFNAADTLNWATPQPPTYCPPSHAALQPAAAHPMTACSNESLNLADPLSPDYCLPSPGAGGAGAAAAVAAMQPGLGYALNWAAYQLPHLSPPSHAAMQPATANPMLAGLDETLNLADPLSPDYCAPLAAASAAVQPHQASVTNADTLNCATPHPPAYYLPPHAATQPAATHHISGSNAATSLNVAEPESPEYCALPPADMHAACAYNLPLPTTADDVEMEESLHYQTLHEALAQQLLRPAGNNIQQPHDVSPPCYYVLPPGQAASTGGMNAIEHGTPLGMYQDEGLQAAHYPTGADQATFVETAAEYSQVYTGPLPEASLELPAKMASDGVIHDFDTSRQGICSFADARGLQVLGYNCVKVGSELQSGGCGSVYNATVRWDEAPKVLKRMHTTPDPAPKEIQGNQKALLHEAHFSTAVPHRSIPGCEALVIDANGNLYGILFAKAQSGDYLDYLNDRVIAAQPCTKLEDEPGFVKNVDNSTKVFIHIAEALQASHAAGVVHCDLKEGNVTLEVDDERNSYTGKVIDHGMAQRVGSVLRCTIGTPGYMSPEMEAISKYGRPAHATPEMDMWSVGVMLHNTYEALHGLIALYNFPALHDLVWEFEELSFKCMKENPLERVDANTLLGELLDLQQKVDEINALVSEQI